MSAPDHEAPESRRQHRPALTVLMVVAGVVLLFPGLCSLFFIFALFGDDFKDALNDAGLVALWAICLALSAGGVLLIRHAVRRKKA
ncbi:MAG: hypothetical protein ACJ8EJ_22215 [Xanthobacteraceae bacterium]